MGHGFVQAKVTGAKTPVSSSYSKTSHADVRPHLVEPEISVLNLRHLWHKKQMTLLVFLEEV